MELESNYKNYKGSYEIIANIIMDWNKKIIYRTFYKLEQKKGLEFLK